MSIPPFSILFGLHPRSGHMWSAHLSAPMQRSVVRRQYATDRLRRQQRPNLWEREGALQHSPLSPNPIGDLASATACI